jgi:hypothetical protein
MQSANIFVRTKRNFEKKNFISEAVALGLPSVAAVASNADFVMKETFATTFFYIMLLPVDPPPPPLELRKVFRNYSINNMGEERGVYRVLVGKPGGGGEGTPAGTWGEGGGKY